MNQNNRKSEAGDQSFRDRIATVDEDGKRIWLYPRKPNGRFYRWRTYVSYVLFVVLFGLPFIKLNGRPLILLNIWERKFIIFGVGFWPQDFHLFALSAITFVVFIILFTVVFGRIFCGWFCPQTIFLEMLFRKIEYMIEGDSHKQRQLDAAPWTKDKILKKLLKHVIFYTLSVLIANTFLSYIIGVDELFKIVTEPVSQHVQGFVAMLLFSLVFYGVFSRFREQVCVMVCPYGRLQGVLLDKNSIAVSYDYKRGEPRGLNKKVSEPASQKLGDCIDCHLCVDVCPTGIDIRNGTQLECVNCTACMDACDGVMNKLKRPSGLIRYSSYDGIAEGNNRHFTPRVMAYSVVLLVLASFVVFLLMHRKPIETTILRTPGSLNQVISAGVLQNVYNVQVVNKSYENKSVTFKIINRADATLKSAGQTPLPLLSDKVAETILFVSMPEDGLKLANEPITVGVYVDGKLIEEVKTNFRTRVGL